MADGIKIRSLNVTTTVRRSDVLIVDKINSLTNENITYQISVNDFANAIIENPDNTIGSLADVTISNVQQGDLLVYDGNKWVNSQPEQTAGEFEGDSLVFNTSTAPVVFKVTVGDRTSAHRFYNATTSTKSYFIDDVEAPSMMLAPGRRYRFDISDPSNTGYDLRFYKAPTNVGFLNAVYSNPDLNDVTVFGTAGQVGAYIDLFITQKYEGDAIQGTVLTDETPEKLFYNVEPNSLENFMGNSILNAGVIEETAFEPIGGDGVFPMLASQISALETKVEELENHISRLIEIE